MTSISNGESGLSVRTKLNSSLTVTDAFTVSGGNVGIGITPTAKLAVRDGDVPRIAYFSGASFGVRIGSNAAGGNIEAVDAVNGLLSYQPLVLAGSTFAVGTGASSTERMRIDTSGNVGIGTTTPTSKLEVVGAVRASSGATGGYYGLRYDPAQANSRSWAIYNDYATLGDLNVVTSTTQTGATNLSRFYIDASGNVGIGTTTPNAASIVDAQSITKGVRFPNMTTTQKNAIANVAGNVVFDTTLGKLCVNTGAGWQTITSV